MKKSYRVIAMICALIMLMTLSIGAEGEKEYYIQSGEPTIWISCATQAEVGRQTTVKVFAANFNGAASIEFAINYDANVLEYKAFDSDYATVYEVTLPKEGTTSVFVSDIKYDYTESSGTCLIELYYMVKNTDLNETVVSLEYAVAHNTELTNIKMVEDTLEIKQEHNHTYGEWTNTDELNHSRTCSECKNTVFEPHVFDKEIISQATLASPATCENNATYYYSCICGALGTDTFVYENSSTGSHSWDDGVITTPATCAAEGVKTFTCTKCDATRTEEISKLTEHTYGDWTKADATNHTRICSICNNTETKEHIWDNGKITTAPTCIAEGIKTYTCTAKNCETTKTEPVAKSAHIYSETSTDATEDDENHRYYCTTKDCTAYIEKAHTWNNGEITTPASCVRAGETTYTCTVCSGTKTEPIPATGEHIYGEWKADEGKNTHTCACTTDGCTTTKTEAHDWGMWSEDGDSTHTRTCETCKATDAVPHTYGEWTKDDDTNHKRECTAEGCNAAERENHEFINYTTTTEPTCTEEGTETAKCTRCEAKTTRALSIKHDIDTNMLNATCNGIIYSYCDKCGKWICSSDSKPYDVLPAIPTKLETYFNGTIIIAQYDGAQMIGAAAVDDNHNITLPEGGEYCKIFFLGKDLVPQRQCATVHIKA